MASVNKLNKQRAYTHEGGRGSLASDKERLLRLVSTCMLWEKNFYVDGVDVATQIEALVDRISDLKWLHKVAYEMRNLRGIRHATLLVVLAIAKKRHSNVSELLPQVIKRPDDMTELLALLWRDGKCPIPKQIKKGLALCFRKFNEYQLAKYNRDGAVKLRDVMFMVHPKPQSADQKDLWKRLAENTLAVPDTWEVRLSSGENKREVFTDLLVNEKLGGLALLRNLRNMVEAGVDPQLIKAGLPVLNTKLLQPFNYIAAARHAPMFERELEKLMFERLSDFQQLHGPVLILVDVSGSMGDKLSSRSELSRLDAACGVAMVMSEVCYSPYVYSFSSATVAVPPRRGFALADAIKNSQPHGGTYLRRALIEAQKAVDPKLTIVITDEQSHDGAAPPNDHGYIINIANYEVGVGYGQWTHINGWSDSVVEYIITEERALGK